MGQYYYPINLDKKQFVLSHDYDQGLKLMEHSYIGNVLMNVVENLLAPGGDWYKCHLLWAGDYADGEKNGEVVEKNKDGEEEETPNLHSIIGDKKENKIRPDDTDKQFRYIINHTKRLFIDKDKIKNISEEDNYKIHPLSLLTCEGNGRGGGDFRGSDKRVGTWSRDCISMEEEIPAYLLFELTEFDGNFDESKTDDREI